MRTGLLLLLCCLVGLGPASAQKMPELFPRPQEIRTSGEWTGLPSSFRIEGGEGLSPACLRMLETVFGKGGTAAGGFRVIAGKAGDASVRRYRKEIPGQAEGYYLKVDSRKAVLAGRDDRGCFYALQTLAALVRDGRVPVVEIWDFPAVCSRGVVEGFYGTPWKHEARLRQLEFYGRHKLNTYIYGPKDDPYHSCPHWRKPYPPEKAEEIRELVAKARENGVDFVWAVHPGQDIRWDGADRKLLLEKFEAMYGLGVRAFAVFFDDISGAGTDPARQAALLNYIDESFVQVKGDVSPLIMCPTEYNRSWSDPAKGYLSTLGRELNPSVRIMWTGDRVISDIHEEGLEWVNGQIRRPAYIWWNFPVSDYVRDHLLLGAVYGSDTHIAHLMSGFVSNPMERAEASRIAVSGVADYAWNPQAFDSDRSWRHAVRELMPENADMLQLFADHHSDLGENGHGYRREESVALQPLVDQVLAGLRSGRYRGEEFLRLRQEFVRMTECADILEACDENPALITEIRPWLKQFRVLGSSGAAALDLLEDAVRGDSAGFASGYRHLKALQHLRFHIDTTYNRNPYQPGVKSGSKVLQPLADTLFVRAVALYNARTGCRYSGRVFTSPHQSFSSLPQCRLLPVQLKNDLAVLSPLLEVLRWGDGEWVGIVLDRNRQVAAFSADFGLPGKPDWMRVEASEDGETWFEVDTVQKGRGLEAGGSFRARYIRAVNVSGRPQESRLRKFTARLGD